MGVLAVYGVRDASTLIYYGRHNLQHRGQEGAGIAVCDPAGNFNRIRGLGLLSEVFNEKAIASLQAQLDAFAQMIIRQQEVIEAQETTIQELEERLAALEGGQEESPEPES